VNADLHCRRYATIGYNCKKGSHLHWPSKKGTRDLRQSFLNGIRGQTFAGGRGEGKGKKYNISSPL
jgi:hypothetical protein